MLVATIPAGIAGFLGEDAIADDLGEPWQILILLAGGALLLSGPTARLRAEGMGDLGLRHALVMGFAQALALAPGVSRSGITITAGRFMKLDRDSAARFSFLLLIPTVLGAVLLKGVKDVLLGDLPSGWHGPFLVGTLAALGSGLLAIDWLLGFVRTPHVRRLRRLPTRRRCARAARDRERRARRDVLAAADHGRTSRRISSSGVPRWRADAPVGDAGSERGATHVNSRS